jgi:hypothetical protein
MTTRGLTMSIDAQSNPPEVVVSMTITNLMVHMDELIP